MKVMLPVEAIRHRGFVLHTVQTAILDFGRMSKPAPCSSLFCEHFWQVESYIRHVVGGFLDKCAAKHGGCSYWSSLSSTYIELFIRCAANTLPCLMFHAAWQL